MPPPVFLLSRFFRLLQDQIHRLNIARKAMALDLCQTVGRLIGIVTIRFTLSEAQTGATAIPAGTRVTDGEVYFTYAYRHQD